jgi:hypothetical protein
MRKVRVHKSKIVQNLLDNISNEKRQDVHRDMLKELEKIDNINDNNE